MLISSAPAVDIRIGWEKADGMSWPDHRVLAAGAEYTAYNKQDIDTRFTPARQYKENGAQQPATPHISLDSLWK
jgi:hypothetical protein